MAVSAVTLAKPADDSPATAIGERFSMRHAQVFR
jgi:hypothetical protein